MAKYINKDDYLKKFGDDLDMKFKTSNFTTDNAVDNFLEQIEDETILFLKANYHQAIPISTIVETDDDGNYVHPEFFKDFKNGLLYQARYVFENGQGTLDSERPNFSTLSRPAKNCFKLACLCNLNECDVLWE